MPNASKMAVANAQEAWLRYLNEHTEIGVQNMAWRIALCDAYKEAYIAGVNSVGLECTRPDICTCPCGELARIPASYTEQS